MVQSVERGGDWQDGWEGKGRGSGKGATQVDVPGKLEAAAAAPRHSLGTTPACNEIFSSAASNPGSVCKQTQTRHADQP